jgi:hypothetical protein
MFPVDGTIDTIKLIYHGGQGSEYLDSTYMVIYLGSIHKSIPIAIPLPP